MLVDFNFFNNYIVHVNKGMVGLVMWIFLEIGSLILIFNNQI